MDPELCLECIDILASHLREKIPSRQFPEILVEPHARHSFYCERENKIVLNKDSEKNLAALMEESSHFCRSYFQGRIGKQGLPNMPVVEEFFGRLGESVGFRAGAHRIPVQAERDHSSDFSYAKAMESLQSQYASIQGAQQSRQKFFDEGWDKKLVGAIHRHRASICDVANQVHLGRIEFSAAKKIFIEKTNTMIDNLDQLLNLCQNEGKSVPDLFLGELSHYQRFNLEHVHVELGRFETPYHSTSAIDTAIGQHIHRCLGSSLVLQKIATDAKLACKGILEAELTDYRSKVYHFQGYVLAELFVKQCPDFMELSRALYRASNETVAQMLSKMKHSPGLWDIDI